MGALGRIGMVAGLHVAVLYLIARSLGLVPVPPVIHMDGTVIDEPRPVDPLPPPPSDPRIKDDVFDIPVPRQDVPIDDDPPPPTDRISGSTDIEVPPGPGTAEPQPLIRGVALDPRYPLAEPEYDPIDRREGNQGSADIEVYVLPDGRVGDARIVRSSGFERLDRNALSTARLKWRLSPATRDGVPFAQWHRLRVVFKLRTQ